MISSPVCAMRRKLGCLLICMLCVPLLVGCDLAPPRSRPLAVVATILPLADWAREVGGDRVQVQLIVPPGLDPRTYEPTAAQRRQIRAADVVLLNGLGLEPWIDELLDAARTTRMVVLDVSLFMGPLVERPPLTGPEAPNSDNAGNGVRASTEQEQLAPPPIRSAYLWLDPRAAMGQVDLVARTLTRADPQGMAVYRQNAAGYNAELENLDSRIQRQIYTWRWQSLVADEPFLYPFARHYSLPLLQPGEPGRLIVIDPDAPLLLDGLTHKLPSVSSLIQRRPVAVLNPLAGRTYIELMQTNTYTMTTVLAGR